MNEGNNTKLLTLFGWPEFWFVLFLTAGYFKEHYLFSWLPIDYTLLCFIISFFLILKKWLLSNPTINFSFYLWIILFSLILIPTIVFFDLSGYSGEKILKFYILTFWAAIAPVLFIRNELDFLKFLNIYFWISFIIALNAIINIFFILDSTQRPASFSADTIGIGRTSGIGILYLSFLIVSTGKNLTKYFLLLAIFFISLIGAASKGPIFAVFFCLMLLFFLGQYKSKRFWKTAFFVLGPVIILITLLFPYFPQLTTIKLLRVLNVQFTDPSTNTRVESYTETFEQILSNPFGVGLGNFSEHIQVYDYGEIINYPHNIFLEVFIEGGWLPGVFFLLIVFMAILRSFNKIKWFKRVTMLLFLVLIFLSVNALFSFDLNGNRLFFVLISISLVWKETKPAHSSDNTHGR